MSLDERAQLAEVVRLFPSSRVLGSTREQRVEVEHRGFLIAVRFAPDHPFSPPHIYLFPGVVSSHFYPHRGELVPRLCWCRDAEWSPRLHLVVAVLAAMRFLNEYTAGGAR